MQSRNVSEQLLKNLLLKLLQGNFDSDRALKLEDIYGKWGMTFVFEVGVYLLPMPLLVTLIMFVIFKRRKLLGVTQKFIISIMILDLCFSSTSVIRDTILKVQHMEYGFLEYHACSWVLFSLRLQMICHATSVWLNTLMAFHHLLLVSYPIKVRMCNLPPYFYTFIFVHVLICCTFHLLLIAPDFQSVPLIQEFRVGYPLKKNRRVYFTYKGDLWGIFFILWLNDNHVRLNIIQPDNPVLFTLDSISRTCCLVT